MTDSTLSPTQLPADFTRANASYRRHAWLAMAGLLGFLLIYGALLVFFAWMTYRGALAFDQGKMNLGQIVITVCSLLLSVFMIKSLFAVRKAGSPGGVEVTPAEEPRLFDFLHDLADSIGAPRPHRVFITAEVNASVFYDLSLLNLLLPTKKNLIVGLGLVNVLNRGEIKAVLAHEFGHFSQSSMMVGRWVYLSQQIISHMVATRDWFDSIVRFVSRVDIRIAWLGWLLGLILWSIRSLMETLFSLVIMAERALSREMEFHADLVAVSVTGSDALVNALHKLQAADHAWQTALSVASSQANGGKMLEDLFEAQRATVVEMRRVLSDPQYGITPQPESTANAAAHRVFDDESARPPQMWATHPANRDREDNAKSIYIAAEIDDTSAWSLFSDPAALRCTLSRSFYRVKDGNELEVVSPVSAVEQRFANITYSPEYRGTYLGRSPMRSFRSVAEMLELGTAGSNAAASLANLYPAALADDLEAARNLDIERQTLEALERGELKPSGGVIRHRGEELSRAEIPEAIESIVEERKVVADRLKSHDASCRRAHLQAARESGNGWEEYWRGLVGLTHATDHLAARVENEQALLVNTWNVITADGQVGYFEKRRMLGVCEQVQESLRQVTRSASALRLTEEIAQATGIKNWRKQCPKFDLAAVDKKNWVDWCQAAFNVIGDLAYALRLVHGHALESLLACESRLEASVRKSTPLDPAPKPALVPDEYPTLLPNEEHVLQRKLDLWNRFQLAHGFMPTLARLVVAIGIVGGTIYGGVMGF